MEVSYTHIDGVIMNNGFGGFSAINKLRIMGDSLGTALNTTSKLTEFNTYK